MKTVCIIKENIDHYIGKETLFRPSEAYPEYLFKDDISSREENTVYRMIREGLAALGMDAAKLGTAAWNPLGSLISQGDTVLIKPNLVKHVNDSGCGTDCLYTNPSLVAAIVDYVCIALNGTGKIVIGDAPLQECEFDTLISQSGYDVLCDYYRKKGIDIELIDFRNVKTYKRGGVSFCQEEEREDGCVVHLDEGSAFKNVDEVKMKKFRITDYDPRILQQHHHEKVHEYNVSRYVLEADVIINMPKPKTHRKAGVTIALKNLVGINANKEYLPHHTNGSKDEGGDCYLHTNSLLETANGLLDIKNQLAHDKEYELSKMAMDLYARVYEKGRTQSSEEYWEGSWYGNDTIWRTIIDLNRILLYSDKQGNMTPERQRKMFIVGDMIVSGEKEGPLSPSPIYPGIIVMGDEPVIFDRAVCSLMGFDYRLIPTLYNEELAKGKYPIMDTDDLEIISNDEKWSHKDLDEIREHSSLEFQPTSGWGPKLGNRYKDRLYDSLRNSGDSVYIFGAGGNGVYAAEELTKQGIKVAAFCDNNPDIWGKKIANCAECIEPCKAEINKGFIIAMRDKNVSEITEQIKKIGGTVLGVINR